MIVYCKYKWGELKAMEAHSGLYAYGPYAYKICSLCKYTWDAFAAEPKVEIGYTERIK